ncbi:MAG: cation:proton antiporter, partial [Planctomycetota bacterium]|nr:cation:proton antiporter [Planctomycetota bacterium]
MPHTFLTDIVLLLAASIPIVVLLRRVQLPSVAGFVVAGALFGPHALSWIRSVEEVEALAEIGVALLLFTVGLEFSLPRLLLLKRALLVGGFGQVALTLLVVGLGGIALGRDVSGAVLFAFLVVLSSTAVVLKTLTDERQVDTPHGQLAVAILLFQDLAIIPLLLFVPLLGGGGGGGFADFGVAGAKAVVAVVVVLLAARYGFSRMSPVVVRAGGRELFTLFTVLVALGAAWLTESLDLPLALGAFIAGLVVSESEYNHQVVDEILPFRDVFSALFFVSIGMLFDASIVIEEPVATLSLFLAVAGTKAAVVFGVGYYLTRSRRTAMIVAAALFQVGEFAFVVASQARELGVLGGADEQRFLAVAVLSMVVTPVVMRLAWRRGDAGRPSSANGGDGVQPEDAPRVLIAGFGLTGEHLARVLAATGVDHRVLDTDPDRVKRERAAGVP